MIGTLNPSQIFNLMVEQPGSAAGRDAAVRGIAKLREAEVAALRDRIINAAQPESKDHGDFKVPYVRGYLFSQLGNLAEGEPRAVNLLLKHVQPEAEADHWVRFWALSGCVSAKIAKLEEIAGWITRQYTHNDPGEDHKSVMLGHAILAVQKQETAHIQPVQTPLQTWLNENVMRDSANKKALRQHCQDALRVLGIFSIPELIPDIISVLQTTNADPRTYFLAVQALGNVPAKFPAIVSKANRALLEFVEQAGNTRVLSSVRIEAIRSLGELGDPSAEPLLMKEIRAGSLDIIQVAAESLVKILGIEKAVQRVLEASQKDANPHTRKNFSISLRWMSEDKVAVTEALDHELATGTLPQQENARMLMAEMGGAAAMDKLGSRQKAVEEFKTMLLGEQDKFQRLFDSTMKEARQGFRIALSMDVIVFGLGIVMLLALLIYAFATDTVDKFVGVGMGGVGVLGIVYGTLIANPRKKVFKSVNALMNFKVIFLAYLRNLHQADQTFTRMLLEDESLGTDKLADFTELINSMLEEAVEKMVALKEQELKEKKADYAGEYKLKSLAVKQKIAAMRYGYGAKKPEGNRPVPMEKTPFSPSSLASEEVDSFSFSEDQEEVSPPANEYPKPTKDSPLQENLSPPSVLKSSPSRQKRASAIPVEVLKHLKLREGWRQEVYLDSLGKPTAGLGHLLLKEEKAKYKVGDRVPDSVLNAWAEKDAARAYHAAQGQAKQLGIAAPSFIAVLASVNFQLGTGWYKIHKNTWSLMQKKQWEQAAEAAQNSAWYRQTPVRVKDFQDGLRKLITIPKPPIPNSIKKTSPSSSPMTLGLSQTVGKAGVNLAADVVKIQLALKVMGHFRSDTELRNCQAKGPNEKIAELNATVEAIQEFQKIGLGLRSPDGLISPQGLTHRNIQNRYRLITEFESYQIGKIPIAPVLSEADWISQFPDNPTSNGSGRGLKESEKAYPGKRNMVCCWDAAQAMVLQKGIEIKNNTPDRIQVFLQTGGQNHVMAKQAEMGIKYIDKELARGRPVFVGVDDGRTASYNADETTEHYVVIMSKLIKDEEVYYRFFDPGTSHGAAKGYHENNLFKLESEFVLKGSKDWSGAGIKKSYTVAQIRQNK